MHEFQARELLAQYGVSIPGGRLATNAEEGAQAAAELGFPAVIKAQVLSGGRGKAHGVALVRDAAEALAVCRRILALSINGYAVSRILVVQAIAISKEYYLALTVDRGAKRIACILSAAGGVDIEETARKDPAKIVTIPFPGDACGELPLGSLSPIFGVHAPTVRLLLAKLYRLFREKDCSLVEVNPLVLSAGNEIVAADAKIVIDDNALFKHPELEGMRNPEEYSADEIEAQKCRLSFVALDGSVGCMVNGAGLAMATMDLIQLLGGRPANFLDVGGSSNPEKVLAAFRILAANRSVRAILVNIFGGITRCDDIARGIILARERLQISVPLVIRLIGTNAEQGRALLHGAGLSAYTGMTEAVREAVRLAERAA